MNKKPRLVLDQDDVLAATHAQIADHVHTHFGTGLHREEFNNGRFQDILSPDDQKRVYQLIRQPGFFSTIPVMSGAVEAVQTLSKKYDIFVATAAMEFPNSFREKYDWLQTHFPFIHWKNIVFCGDKSIINGDILIDDMPYNLDTFAGRGLLFDAPHNRDIDAYERVLGWSEIVEKLG